MPLTASTPRLSYLIEGESGSPVLLIMGFAMQGAVWRPQLDDLREHHRVAAFDHRGVGGSEISAGRWAMADMAHDALRVADELGWERLHVVGVSMGGMIAQEVALAAEGRLLSLTLIATHAGGGLRWVPRPAAVRAALAGRLAGGDRRAVLERLLYTPGYLRSADPAELDERMRERLESGATPRAQRTQLAAVRRHHTAPRLGRLRVPTLILRPGRDVLIPPAENDRLHRLIPGSRLERIDDAGHGLILESRDRVNELLREHLARHDPTAVG